MPAERRRLTGWGRTAPSVARVVAVDDEDAVRKAGDDAPARGLIARGLGRSYNDAAQNGGGSVLDLTACGRIGAFEPSRGVATVAAGVSIDDLLRVYLPQGWFPPVTPGTRSVTMGGAIAADVHGKNHHRDGSVANFVDRIRLWSPATGVVDVDRASDADAFWATTGGMGLTGVIVEADIRLRAVETSRMSVDVDRAGDLDEAMALMSSGDADYPYSVAWIDCQAGGRRLGRSVLTRARHATVDDLPARDRANPLEVGASKSVPAPPWVPSGLMNRLSIRAFNELWFRKSPRRERGRLVPHGPFFYPLDMVDGWNRLYGPRGFVQYQFVVPFGAEDALRSAVESLSASGAASFLAVLKRFGDGTPGHLSFPAPGWTLALDLPVTSRLRDLLDELDGRVVDAGGRCYLAKDGRVRPDLVARMYPRLDEWRRVQRRLDPDGVLRSDLARRLDLLGDGSQA